MTRSARRTFPFKNDILGKRLSMVGMVRTMGVVKTMRVVKTREMVGMVGMVICSISILFSLFTSFPVHAQLTPDPKTKEVQISASVRDNEPPTTPLLIAPANNSIITTNLVTFIWTGSTDENGIADYDISLDGQPFIEDISAHNHQTNQYSLIYDPSNNKFSLTLKQPLSDGSHTWKVRAYDTLGNGTDSATWSFTIDSQAPTFVLTQIGDVNTSISAQDPSTVPGSPIEIHLNEPQLFGSGEPHSTVQLTVTIPGDPTKQYVDDIDINGNWGHQLGILPREIILTLDFLITDQAGNISVLNDVRFIIKRDVIVYPPVSPSPDSSPQASPDISPTPTPGVSPSPGASGIGQTSPPPSPISSEGPVAKPLIVIPFTPPREIAYEILQEAYERLPMSLKAIVANIPESTKQQIATVGRRLAPFSALVVVAALPLISIAFIATQFGSKFSFYLFIRLLQALGLLPSGKPQGLVYDSKTHKGIPFALITITSAPEETNLENSTQNSSISIPTRSLPLIETVITDINGVYSNVELPPGKYQIQVAHQDYRFPANTVRPPYLQLRDYYRGEVFSIERHQENEILFMIPVDPLRTDGKESFTSRLRLSLARMSRYSSALVLPLFVLTGILTLIYPTIWNWIVFGLYTVMLGWKATKWFKIPTVTGTVVNAQGEPLSHALIRLIDPRTNQLVAILTSSPDGSFAAQVSKGEYQLMVIKPGYLWDEGSGSSLYMVDARQEPIYVAVVMNSMELSN